MKRSLLVIVAIVALGGTALAAETPQEQANRLSNEIMSPFCPGLTLHDCPSDPARALRDEIERLAAAGYSDAQIISSLEDEYGPNLRAVPADGNGFLVWAIPGLALAAGLVLAAVVARRWNRSGPQPSDGPTINSPTAEDRRRLDAELTGQKDRYGWRV